MRWPLAQAKLWVAVHDHLPGDDRLVYTRHCTLLWGCFLNPRVIVGFTRTDAFRMENAGESTSSRQTEMGAEQKAEEEKLGERQKLAKTYATQSNLGLAPGD